MSEKRNPAAGKRQGFDIVTSSNPTYIAAPSQTQQLYDPILWLSQRSGVALSTAKTYAELNRWGRS